MNPQQNPNPPVQEPIPQPKQPENPYEFIMNPPQPPKKSSPFSGLGKMPIYIGAGLGLLLLVFLVLALMSGGGNSSTTVQLASLAAEQEEIIRVSDLALKSSKDTATLTTATTVKASLVSEQKQALDLMSSQGGKLAKGQLNSKKDSKTDAEIAQAVQSNTLSKVYNDYLAQSLRDYQKKLKTLYVDGGPKSKAFADTAFQSSETIIKSL